MKSLPQLSQNEQQSLMKAFSKVVMRYKSIKSQLLTHLILTSITFVAIIALFFRNKSLGSLKLDALFTLVAIVPIAALIYFDIIRKAIKNLNALCAQCSDNKLKYSQFKALVKSNPELTNQYQEILKSAVPQQAQPKTISYDLVLTASEKTTDVVSALVKCGLSISEAEHAAQNAPTILFEGLNEDTAFQYAGLLESVGATVQINESKVTVPVESPEEKARRTTIKRNETALTYIENGAYVLLMILFALPMFSFLLIYEESIFSFLFSNSSSSDGLIGAFMEDFLKLENDSYKNIFSIFSNFTIHTPFYALSVLAICLTTLIMALFVITEIIDYVQRLFKDDQPDSPQTEIYKTYTEKLSNLTEQERTFKKAKTIALFIKHLVSKLIRVGLLLYFPVSLVMFFIDNGLVHVNSSFYVFAGIAIFTNIVANVIRWLYKAKYAVELNNIDYLKKVFK